MVFKQTSFISIVNRNCEKNYTKKINGIQVRSKCKWYEDGEKSAMLSVNLSLPKLNDNQTLECEGVIKENQLLKDLTSMDNDTTLGK